MELDQRQLTAASIVTALRTIGYSGPHVDEAPIRHMVYTTLGRQVEFYELRRIIENLNHILGTDIRWQDVEAFIKGEAHYIRTIEAEEEERERANTTTITINR